MKERSLYFGKPKLKSVEAIFEGLMIEKINDSELIKLGRLPKCGIVTQVLRFSVSGECHHVDATPS
jgi:hypothetical protein